MRKLNTGVIFGILFILAGVILIFQVINVNINIDMSMLWWSFLAIAGLLIIINDRRLSIFPSLLIVVGLWFLLKDAGIVRASIFSLIWPIVLIVIGINIIANKTMFPKTRTPEQTKEGILVYNGVFGAVEERLNTKDFKGLNANASFGGVELDLRDIEIVDKEVVVEASAVFGGVTLIMPNQYNIVIGESVGIFGGNENKCKSQFDENRKTIYVNCRAIFGGVEIK